MAQLVPGRLWPSFVPALVVFLPLVTVSGCQTAQPTMSVEEAKTVTATFSGATFVAPPRTISDVRAELAAAEILDPAFRGARAAADLAPPATSDPSVLGQFYHWRGSVALYVGRTRQAIEDLARAAEYIPPASSLAFDPGMTILRDLAEAEAAAGNYWSAIRRYERAVQAAQPARMRGWLFQLYAGIAELEALTGDIGAANRTLGQLTALWWESRRWPDNHPLWEADRQSALVSAQAIVLELRGRPSEAERYWRQSIAALAPFGTHAWLGPRFDAHTARLSVCLVRQGRLLEAEMEMRKSLRSALRRSYPWGRGEPGSVTGSRPIATAAITTQLAAVLRQQGRYAEAESLAQVALQITERSDAPAASSLAVAAPRRELARALVAQRRWHEALEQYSALRAWLRDDALYERLLAGDFGLPLALVKANRAKEASERLEKATRDVERIVGNRHPTSAEMRGLLGIALAARGEDTRALVEFAHAAEVLVGRSHEADEAWGTRAESDQRLRWILDAYIDLLGRLQDRALQAGGDPVAEAFRLADIARGRFVQRALDAAAARSAATTPALAELVRREQDTAKQIGALYGLLTTAVSGPQNPKVVADLRERIDALARARETLARQIAKDYPAYAQLVNPPPVTVEQARTALRPGEALIATLVTDDKTYVWAVPKTGPVAFSSVPLGETALEEKVGRLRRALDPRVRTLGEIPAFDAATAHELYRVLLEPVKQAWQGANSLLVVGHGPLGQLPFAVLPTEPKGPTMQREPLFSSYRAMPWLVRSHAVVTLPSVSALVTLRRLPPAPADRRPFVGFGDPYFSEAQAREAATERAATTAASVDSPLPAYRLALRDVMVSPAADVETSKLAMLPRLPDTAEEIRSIARVVGANLASDVFLGTSANEQTVKTLDLTRYRAIAFATHGLVPGDLDGLTQPALALTAPEVAKVEGDGLLTMEKILALRLDADWVVLSACNTANGAGKGAEAISGLGRAFFYAGARALLVTHWPVETTSARALTTGLFRRQADDPTLTRAKALQQTMNALIDDGGLIDPATGKMVFSYAHPIFWAPFALVGDGG